MKRLEAGVGAEGSRGREERQEEMLDSLVERLRAEGAGEGLVLIDLLKLEQMHVEALRIVRRQINDLVKRTSPSDLI